MNAKENELIKTEQTELFCKCGGKLQIVTTRRNKDKNRYKGQTAPWYSEDHYRCECLLCGKATAWFPRAEIAQEAFYKKNEYGEACADTIYDRYNPAITIQATGFICPCCRSRVTLLTERTIYDNMYRCECNICKIRTDWFDNAEKATKQWKEKLEELAIEILEEESAIKARVNKLINNMRNLGYSEEYINIVIKRLPVKPVEPHGRLVDIDKFLHESGLDKAKKYNSEDRSYSYSTMMMYEIADMIDEMPVAVEATD